MKKYRHAPADFELAPGRDRRRVIARTGHALTHAGMAMFDPRWISASRAKTSRAGAVDPAPLGS